MAYGSREGKRKKIKKVNHMNATTLREKIEEMKTFGQGSSKYYQHMTNRLNHL